MTIAQALDGLNGWFRWNAWAAHFFVDGVQSCNTQHAYAEGGMARGLPPVRPAPAELTAYDRLPFGRICQRCLKAFRARKLVESGRG